MRPLIIGLGELLWDLLPDGPQLGGAPANFAYQAHCLGADAQVVSAVGHDDWGSRALQRLREVGLSTDHIEELPDHPTGTVQVEIGGHGQPSYTIVENVAWDFLELTPDFAALAGRAQAVCFGSLAQRSPASRAAIGGFLGLTRPECLRVFDINLRPPFVDAEIVRHSLSLASALKLNDAELPQLAMILGWEDAEATVFDRLLHEYALQFVALTRGAEGATLVTTRERLDLPGKPPAQLADTIGAGDAFTAALVVGWLENRPLAEIGQRAIALASYVCSREGGMPPCQPATSS